MLTDMACDYCESYENKTVVGEYVKGHPDLSMYAMCKQYEFVRNVLWSKYYKTPFSREAFFDKGITHILNWINLSFTEVGKIMVLIQNERVVSKNVEGLLEAAEVDRELSMAGCYMLLSQFHDLFLFYRSLFFNKDLIDITHPNKMSASKMQSIKANEYELNKLISESRDRRAIGVFASLRKKGFEDPLDTLGVLWVWLESSAKLLSNANLLVNNVSQSIADIQGLIEKLKEIYDTNGNRFKWQYSKFDSRLND